MLKEEQRREEPEEAKEPHRRRSRPIEVQEEERKSGKSSKNSEESKRDSQEEIDMLFSAEEFTNKKRLVYNTLSSQKDQDYIAYKPADLLALVQDKNKSTITKIESEEDLMKIVRAMEKDNQLLVSDEGEIVFVNL